MKPYSISILLILLGFGLTASLSAKTLDTKSERILRSDPNQVKVWRQFVDALYAMHLENLEGRKIETRHRIGGYAGYPNFYREITYLDADRNIVLSRLQWERDNPDNLHLIEVFIHDKNGKVSEDYLAAYLPRFRNAPIQTLINFHAYNNGLHSFRQYDASGRHIYDQCSGRFAGHTVFYSIEEDELPTAEGSEPEFMRKKDYQACFAGLDVRIEDYLDLVFSYRSEPTRTSNTAAERHPDYDWEERLNDLSAAIKAHPQEARFYLSRGNLYLDLHQFDDAIKDYSTALQLDDSLDEAYFGRGMAFGRDSQFDRAISDLSVFIRRNPGSSKAYTKRGVRYLWNGKYEHAKSDFIRALALDAKNAEAHDDLGVIYAQQGELNKALRHFESSGRFDPTYQKAHHNKAMVLYSMKQYDAALKSVNRALELDPDNRNSNKLKALILEATGDNDAAQVFYEKAEFLPQGNWSERLTVNIK